VDLVATEIEYLEENKVIVKYGFSTEIPEGYKVFIMPRSSFTHKGWAMQNSPGVVDSDYRGEWMSKFEAIPVGLINGMNTIGPLIYEDFPYKKGDRVAQCSIEVNIHMAFKEVQDLSETIRGTGGFGSTGNK
jgi:dUTP pyrophosphatase